MDIPFFALMGVFSCQICGDKLTEDNCIYCMGCHTFVCSVGCQSTMYTETFFPLEGKPNDETNSDLPEV